MNNKNFYLFYGEDKAILNKEVDNLKRNLSINEDDVIYYDIENIYDIIEEASTISMFSPNKFIIIDWPLKNTIYSNVSDISCPSHANLKLLNI